MSNFLKCENICSWFISSINTWVNQYSKDVGLMTTGATKHCEQHVCIFMKPYIFQCVAAGRDKRMTNLSKNKAFLISLNKNLLLIILNVFIREQ